MPQMAPYNWFNMYLMFNMIYILMISYIYFMNYNSIKSNLVSINKNFFTWMW